MKRAAAILISMFLLGACKQAGTSVVSTPTSTTATSQSSPQPSPQTGPCSELTGGRDGVFVYLISVTPAQGSSTDSVTFKFQASGTGEATLPKYQIATVTPPLKKDPSDQPMEVEGNNFSQVIFHGATGVDLSQSPYRETYTGDKRISTNYPVLVEVQEQSDFEATLSWIMGTSRHSCPAGTEGPLALTIKFPH